jgi:hypothetical protein
MKKVCLSLAVMCSFAFVLAVTALHVSPENTNPDTDIELMLEITQDAENIAGVDIHYRLVGENIWQSEAMRQDNPGSVYWRGAIPRNVVANDELEYRFELKLISGNTEYIPTNDDKTFFKINPRAPKGTQTDGFVLLTDESSISADDGYVLAVSFMALAEDIDAKSIKVFVGGRDVSKHTQISGSVLMYREDRPQAGIQKAMVVATVKGRQMYSDTWITQILPGTKKVAFPIKMRGTVNLSANVYDESSNANSFSAGTNDYRTWADLYGNYGILDMQANLLFSSLEDANSQPVNRYTFGLSLPVLDILVGDNSPSLSKYTLSGKNIRGLYASLHGEYMALTMTHGESIRKTTYAGDPSNGIPQSGTFKQEAIGARLRLGREDGFSLGFSGSRHRDIISSLEEEYYRYQNAAGDTVYSALAQDNAVVSLDAQLSVLDQHVIMGIDMAGSILNKNTIPGPLSVEDLEDYGLDLNFGSVEIVPADYAQMFVINKNMEPLLPSKTNMAMTAFLRMYFWNSFLNIQYSETGSSFYALGAFSPLKDTKMLTITNQTSFGRLLSISAGYSSTQDNLMGHKSETNNYENINAQLILRIPRMPYLKASFYDNIGKNAQNCAIMDSSFVPYNRDSRNISVGLGYNITQIPYVPTQLDIGYRFGNDFSESDTGTAQGFESLTENENNGLNLTMNNRFTILPLRTQVSYSSSQNKNIMLNQVFENSSVFFRADMSFWQNQIKPFVSYRATELKGDYDPQQYSDFHLGVESYPRKNLTATADLGFKSYTNDDDSNRDYDTTTFRICLTQRF